MDYTSEVESIPAALGELAYKWRIFIAKAEPTSKMSGDATQKGEIQDIALGGGVWERGPFVGSGGKHADGFPVGCAGSGVIGRNKVQQFRTFVHQ